MSNEANGDERNGSQKPFTRTLPRDICRCHDHECPLNVGCLRYEQRDSGTVHALGTMRDVESGVCYERIAEPRRPGGRKGTASLLTKRNPGSL